MERMAWLKVLKLLVSATILAALLALVFQMWILLGKGFDLSETFLNATSSAPFSRFLLPAIFAVFGAVVGSAISQQRLVASLFVVVALGYQSLSHPFWVAALFSLPAVLVAASSLLSSHFALEKNNV
jgi:hypothetical protein